MCLTLESLLIFLNLIGPDLVQSEPGRFIISTQTGHTHWVETEETWCTMGPQLERMARFDAKPSKG